MAAKLAQNKDVAYLSYKLATIKTDVELELTCEQLEVQQPIADELLGLFKNMSSSAGRRTSRQANGYRQRARNRRPNRRKRSLLMNRPANRQRRSYENYVTILDDVTLESWIEKLKKRQFCFRHGDRQSG